MRIVVTGGAGFIGSHIVDKLCAIGHEVLVIDNLSSGSRDFLHRNAQLFELDIRDGEKLERTFLEFRPEIVCHQAAQINATTSITRPSEDASVNVMGSLNVLAAAQAAGANRFINASSGGAIYGEIDAETSANVTSPPRPRSPYGVHKWAFEQTLRMLDSPSLVSCSLRYANVYGPRQRADGEGGVVARFFVRALRAQPLTVYADAQSPLGAERDYTFIDDVVQANLWALSCARPPNLLNVSSGVATKTVTLANAILDLTHRRSTIEFTPYRAFEARRSVLEPGPWRVAGSKGVDLASGLTKTLDYYRARSLK